MNMISDNRDICIQLWDCYFKDEKIVNLFKRYIGEGDVISYASFKRTLKLVMNAIKNTYGESSCMVEKEPRSSNYTMTIIKGNFDNYNDYKDEAFLINFGIIEENSDEVAAEIENEFNF